MTYTNQKWNAKWKAGLPI